MKMKAKIVTVCLLAAISLASCRDHLIPGDEPGLTSAATVDLSSVTTTSATQTRTTRTTRGGKFFSNTRKPGLAFS